MGHEPSGEVVQVGEGVSDYQVGDKVAVSRRDVLCYDLACTELEYSLKGISLWRRFRKLRCSSREGAS